MPSRRRWIRLRSTATVTLSCLEWPIYQNNSASVGTTSRSFKHSLSDQMQTIGSPFNILTCKPSECYSHTGGLFTLHEEMVPARLISKNSKAYSRRASVLTVFHLTLIGECELLHSSCESLMGLFSDWIKLYLGKRGGTHVLG